MYQLLMKKLGLKIGEMQFGYRNWNVFTLDK